MNHYLANTTGEILLNAFTDPDNWVNWGLILIKIILILVTAGIMKRVTRKAVARIIADREERRIHYDPRRAKTIGKLVGNIANFTINFIVLLLVIDQFGYSLMPLLAGAGVLGLAVGFGAQNLVRDVITGFFIIFEDQFGVGDVIMVNGKKGTVEEIGLRVTKIRIVSGEIHIIPNGAISEVTNFSVNNAIGVTEITLSMESDIDKGVQIIKETITLMKETNTDIIGVPEVFIQKLSTAEAVIQITTECKPNTQLDVDRQMKLELRKSLDRAGMKVI